MNRLTRLPARWGCAAALMLLTLGSTAARGAIVDLTPSADAFVTSALPDANFGGAGAIGAAAVGLPQGEFQSVLRFTTAAAKSSFDATYGAGQWSIQSAVLKLTAAPPNNAIFNASAAGTFAARWMQNDAWLEGTGNPAAPGATGITYNTLPTFVSGSDEALGSFATTGATGGAFTYALNLTPGFTADLLAGDPTSLRLLTADATLSVLFRSREFGTAANRPVLSLTAVPEPHALGLLLFSASVALSRRGSRAPTRRRHAA